MSELKKYSSLAGLTLLAPLVNAYIINNQKKFQKNVKKDSFKKYFSEVQDKQHTFTVEVATALHGIVLDYAEKTFPEITKRQCTNITVPEDKIQELQDFQNQIYGRGRGQKDKDVTGEKQKDSQVFYKLNYGDYKFQYKNETINLYYSVNDKKPLMNNGYYTIQCHERLIIASDNNNDILSDFLIEAKKFSIKKRKAGMVIINYWNNKQKYWQQLHQLPARNLDTIYFDKQKKQELLDDVTNFQEEEEVYKEYGIPYKRTYLFEGVPGAGKSSYIFTLASTFKKNIGIITFNQDMDDSSFMTAITQLQPNSVLLLEDLDCLFRERDTKKNAGQVTFSGVLNTLDGVARRQGLMTFLTTNHADQLDPALLRPGRIDYILHFDSASKDQIYQMFEKYRPDDLNEFERFYELAKFEEKKITCAVLQKFFFEIRKHKDFKEKMQDKVDFLNKISSTHNPAKLIGGDNIKYADTKGGLQPQMGGRF